MSHAIKCQINCVPSATEHGVIRYRSTFLLVSLLLLNISLQLFLNCATFSSPGENKMKNEMTEINEQTNETKQ